LAQQWKALTLMGEIAFNRGDLDGALRRYRQAYAGTAEALRRHPTNPHRMFDHAQSVYWVGEVARQRGAVDQAAAQFREYGRLADRMIAADSDNPKWQLEGVYAASNLGRVQLDQARYPEAALTFQASVRAMDLLMAAEPANAEYLNLLLEALGYHADALDRAGELDLAIRERERQLTLLAPYLALDRPDAGLRQKAMIANLHLSLLRFARGATAPALDQAAKAVDIGNGLVALEPSNADWVGRSANTQLSQATLLLRAGRISEAKAAAEQGCEKTNQLIARDPTVAYWQDNARRCLGLRAELTSLAGSTSEALYLARQVLDRIRSDNINSARDRFALSQAHKLVGDILWRSGDRAGARSAWQAALAAWPKGITETPRQMAERGEMLRGIGQRAEGMQIASQLAAMGYRQSLSNRARV
jgi:tetratricopeptide (TPR) repeat protein